VDNVRLGTADLFVTLIEKILRFGGSISERYPFHGGFIFSLSQASTSNILNQTRILWTGTS